MSWGPSLEFLYGIIIRISVEKNRSKPKSNELSCTPKVQRGDDDNYL